MGQPKPLLPTGNGTETFVDRMVSTLRAGGVDDVVVVVRPELAETVRARLDVKFARVAVNANPEEGQLSSLVAALEAVDHPGMNAVVVTPIDLPLLRSSTVAALIAEYRRTGCPVVRPCRQGRRGHPVIFDRALFGELRRGDRTLGIRPIIEAHRLQSAEVEVDDEGAFLDVDTPEEYRNALGRSFDDPSPGD
jgi:CTP:molybdopterin cytidylyltransferase MocA